MNKNINLNLYKSLIESDFILLSNSLGKNNGYLHNETTLSTNQQIYHFLVLFTLHF